MRSKDFRDLLKTGECIVNPRPRINWDYYNYRYVIAGRDWVCHSCKNKIKKGLPYCRHHFGEAYTNESQTIHICYECEKEYDD